MKRWKEIYANSRIWGKTVRSYGQTCYVQRTLDQQVSFAKLNKSLSREGLPRGRRERESKRRRRKGREGKKRASSRLAELAIRLVRITCLANKNYQSLPVACTRARRNNGGTTRKWFVKAKPFACRDEVDCCCIVTLGRWAEILDSERARTFPLIGNICRRVSRRWSNFSIRVATLRRVRFSRSCSLMARRRCSQSTRINLRS